MPIESPIKLGPNTYYFHGDLWTACELQERWGIAVEAVPDCPKSKDAEAHSPAGLARA